MVLVTWAASYGIDEYGRDTVIPGEVDNLADVARRRTRVNEMVAEMLDLIDHHGLLRRPRLVYHYPHSFQFCADS